MVVKWRFEGTSQKLAIFNVRSLLRIGITTTSVRQLLPVCP
jgi:hypothetical protein